MPGFETVLVVLVGAAIVLGAFGLLASLRAGAASRESEALRELGSGRFAAALERARTGPRAPRDELYAAAVAAKHLLLWERADELLGRILAGDPGDGEAWLERGSVAAYRGRAAAAADAFARALARRSDLAESINLHAAWLALAAGDRAAARRRFDEVEAPLESKLRSDLGPGDPLFAEWFLQAAALWRAEGDAERAGWAAASGRAAAPESRLADLILAAGAGPPGSARSIAVQ